jgi:ketosteroid isomerase-like protein/predicted ester cyclase
MNATRTIVLFSIVGLLACGAPAPAQSPEELTAVRNAFAEAIHNHDIDAILSFFTEDGIHDVPLGGPPLTTPEQMRVLWEDQFGGSPDWHTEEGRILAKDNIVIVDHAAVGTNTRDTDGRPWIWPHLDIYEFEGLKIKRLTSYGDYASILVQLGWAPEPEMPELIPSITMPEPEPTGLSPLEANAETLRCWNAHDAAGLAKMYRKTATIFMGPLGASVDPVAVIALNEGYFQGFSDTRLVPLRTIDMGDGWVLFEHVAIGTHDGDFMGVPPAGHMVEVRSVWLTRFDANGLITEQSVYYDNLTVMTQMTTPPEYSPVGTWVVSVPTLRERSG